MNTPTATEIKLLQKSRSVSFTFDDGKQFTVSCATLRRHSPSAENRDNPPIDENVNITGIEPVGNYAVKFIFDDGHQTGIYSWELLYRLDSS